MEISTNFDIELKKKLLEMMKWLHELCIKHNIRYYVIDGTMLGVIRHQGFIPWDDDIDIGIPRADYEKLASIMKKYPDKRYRLESPDSKANDFIYTYSKLYDTTTTLIEHARIDVKRGIFIDIFPLDGVGNSLEEGRKYFQKLDILFSFYMSRVVAIRPGRKKYKNVAVLLSQAIPSFLMNDKRLLLKVDAMCQKYDFDKSKFGGNLLGTWRFRDVMEKSIMGEPKLYKFENIEVYGVEHYDEYLTHLYGDWRKLPPVEQQVTHHEFIECNLYKGYV